MQIKEQKAANITMIFWSQMIIMCNVLCTKVIFYLWSESCSREELMCDGGRCLLPVSVCDGQINCEDGSDEANCSQKHKGDYSNDVTTQSVIPQSFISLDSKNYNRYHDYLSIFWLLECGGTITGEYGSLSSPNHPKPYPHQQVLITSSI